MHRTRGGRESSTLEKESIATSVSPDHTKFRSQAAEPWHQSLQRKQLQLGGVKARTYDNAATPRLRILSDHLLRRLPVAGRRAPHPGSGRGRPDVVSRSLAVVPRRRLHSFRMRPVGVHGRFGPCLGIHDARRDIVIGVKLTGK